MHVVVFFREDLEVTTGIPPLDGYVLAIAQEAGDRSQLVASGDYYWFDPEDEMWYQVNNTSHALDRVFDGQVVRQGGQVPRQVFEDAKLLAWEEFDKCQKQAHKFR